MYVDGGNLGRIASYLKVSPQTVSSWVTDLAEALPNVPVSKEVKEAEMDEIFTFVRTRHYRVCHPASLQFKIPDFVYLSLEYKMGT